MDAFGPFRAVLILYLAVLPYCLVNSDISCTVISGDYCKFTLGGDITGTIDLSPVFSNGPLEVKNGDFSYQYDACKGVACDSDPCKTDPCAACQKAGNDINHGIGDISTVSCDASQSNPSQNKWIIKLSYTGGTYNSKSDFTFMYSPNDTTPEMTFDREAPALDYHLTIIAKFGVPSVPSTLSCTVVPGDPCKCTLSNGANGTIDLSPLFSNGPLTTVSGDFRYNYDCKGVPCIGKFGTCGGASGQCAACQESIDGSLQYGLGAVSSLSYDVSGSNPDLNIWVVKVTYWEGNDGQSFDESITYNASISSPSMTFVGESPSKFYHLAAGGKFGVPGVPSTLSCTVVPGDFCKCTLSNGVNGTIDLSPLFSNGPLTTADVNYLYTYDGCIGVKCEESCMQGTCAACQSESPRVYGLGALSTVEFNVSRSDPSREIWIIEAVYRGGTKNRTTNVRIEYVPNMPEPEFIFQSESPEFQYNMGLFGTFLVPGGSGPGLACHPDFPSSCKCNLNDSSGSIDLSPVFSQGPLNVTFGNYKYLYDACKGVVCQTPCDPSTQKCAACQDEVTTSYGFGLGALETVRFDVSKSEPSRDSWIVSLSYSGGASGKQFDVLFTHIPSTEKVDFQFLGENPSSSYHFAIYATFDVPGRDGRDP